MEQFLKDWEQGGGGGWLNPETQQWVNQGTASHGESGQPSHEWSSSGAELFSLCADPPAGRGKSMRVWIWLTWPRSDFHSPDTCVPGGGGLMAHEIPIRGCWNCSKKEPVTFARIFIHQAFHPLKTACWFASFLPCSSPLPIFPFPATPLP